MRRTPLLVMAMVVAATLVSGVLVESDTASAQSTAAFPGSVIKVTTKVDELNADGDCSLREAITAANTNAPVDGCKAGSATEQDAIQFAVGKKAKTIVLESQLPVITDPSGLRITGREASVTISGNEQARVFEVVVGAKLALLNLTVADGFDSGSGGGLLNNGGTVKVGNTTFSNNSAGFSGGGIFNNSGGTLTVTNSTFSDNSANSTAFSGGEGGGIFNFLGTVTVTNSTFSNNSANIGGGIKNQGGTLTVSNSTFSNNSANIGGGGLLNDSGGMTTVTNSTFSENSGNIGGGIINNGGTLKVTNSTFSENSANPTAFSGSGLVINGGTATLRNTIVANSTSGGNCAGTINDGGYNIDDGTNCGFSEQQNSLPSTDPLLDDQLAFNGGPTQTIALLADSPAINAIPPSVNGCGTEIKTDQRGVSRPQGSGCDIGAYEKEGTQ